MNDRKRDLENEGWERLRSHMDAPITDGPQNSYRGPDEFHLYGLGNDEDERHVDASDRYGREEFAEHPQSHHFELYGIEEDPNGSFHLYGVGRPEPD